MAIFVYCVVMFGFAGLLWALANRPGWGIALCAPFLFVACSGAFGFSAFAMGGMVLMTWGISRLAGTESPRVYRGLALAALLISITPPLASTIGGGLETIALRREFPVESLEARLAYEPRLPSTDVPLPPLVSANLNDEEVRRNEQFDFVPSSPVGFGRNSSLQQLHEQESFAFEQETGFGVGRVIRRARPNRRSVTIPDRPLTPLPEYIPEPESTEPFAGPFTQDGLPAQAVAAADILAGEANPPPLGLKADLFAAHQASLTDFVPEESLGWIPRPREAAGFEPHGMSQWREQDKVKQIESQFHVVRLELVSLLKHETPKIYVSKNLPQMDELKGVPTRDLDDFETRALSQLSQQDLVVESNGFQVRMLGSIRAIKQCTECHHVRRGELLGAFSYELRAKKPTPTRNAEPTPRT